MLFILQVSILSEQTERFFTSLAFSMVMEVTPGGTVDGPRKEEVEVP